MNEFQTGFNTGFEDARAGRDDIERVACTKSDDYLSGYQAGHVAGATHRETKIGTLTRERALPGAMYLYLREGVDLSLTFGDGARTEIDMTIENRGAVVNLRRDERLVWTPPHGEGSEWYGLDYVTVELRVWHDGSVSVERVIER